MPIFSLLNAIPMRGAYPSPRHVLAASTPHAVAAEALAALPPNLINIPAQLSIWGNLDYGDCVTAEEAFAKACHNPEIVLSDDVVTTWASNHGFLNGAYISDVLQKMQNDGFQDGGHTYDDGPFYSVDWTNADTLKSAISTGPVKIGVGASQLLSTWQSTNGRNGWFAVNYGTETYYDHCTSLCGYGSIGWLANQLQVAVPAGIDPAQPGYGLFTWGSIGIIDIPSLQAITNEAWLRNPTTAVR